MKKEIKNLAASAHDRLRRLARQRGRPFQELFYSYSTERFLYRFSKSSYIDNFVLKGGLMFVGWGIQLRRPTIDIDVQGYTNNTTENLENIVRDICVQEVEPDGMRFDPSSVRGEQIMGNSDYPGSRIYFTGYLGDASIYLHLDVSFANVITPKEILVNYPSLLGMPEFKLYGYPYETVIAEKFQAMVDLGSINSRMKDFFDLWLLSEQVNIAGKTLVRAIQATFQARNTPLPKEIPTALSVDFGQARQVDWNAFLRRSNLNPQEFPSFVEVIEILHEFLWPVVQAALNQDNFDSTWKSGGTWGSK